MVTGVRQSLVARARPALTTRARTGPWPRSPAKILAIAGVHPSTDAVTQRHGCL